MKKVSSDLLGSNQKIENGVVITYFLVLYLLNVILYNPDAPTVITASVLNDTDGKSLCLITEQVAPMSTRKRTILPNTLSLITGSILGS